MIKITIFEEGGRVKVTDSFYHTPRRVHDVIHELEAALFVPRSEALHIFYQIFVTGELPVKVLHVYGPGGVGKSYLLRAFERFSKQHDILYVQMDQDDYTESPEAFASHVLSLLHERVGLYDYKQHANESKPHFLLRVSEELAASRKIIISIDAYRMSGLDRWLRQVFMNHSAPNVLFVFAGRKKLQDEWETSPAWRKLIKQKEIGHFSETETALFLKQSGIDEPQAVKTLWQFTQGHPLTLSLATLTSEEIDWSNREAFAIQVPQILMRLTKVWLQMIIDEELLQIVEAAALFHTFDQSALAAILNQDIRTNLFQELISHSFIKMVKEGWTMHDLMKDAIQVNMKYRNPEYYKILKERLVAYYYKKTITSRSMKDISHFFYHVGDEAIQSAFFSKHMNVPYYVEPVADYNFQEVSEFFKNKRHNVAANDVAFFDRITNKEVRLFVSKEHNEKEMRLINETYVQRMGLDSVRLLKNKQAKTIGLSIVVPIHAQTLPYLAKEPVSRAYFSKLTQQEWDYYDVPEDTSRGLFIRMLDFTKEADTAARSYLLYQLFTYLLAGGTIIASTPIAFYQDLLERFGFEEVPDALHYDYGEVSSAPTYLLDVTGPRFAVYLKKFMENIQHTNHRRVVAEAFTFTEREQEVMLLLLENKKNKEIAETLFVAEVTVKKHVSSILKKTNTANRTALMQRVMELM